MGRPAGSGTFDLGRPRPCFWWLPGPLPVGALLGLRKAARGLKAGLIQPATPLQPVTTRLTLPWPRGQKRHRKAVFVGWPRLALSEQKRIFPAARRATGRFPSVEGSSARPLTMLPGPRGISMPRSSYVRRAGFAPCLAAPAIAAQWSPRSRLIRPNFSPFGPWSRAKSHPHHRHTGFAPWSVGADPRSIPNRTRGHI